MINVHFLYYSRSSTDTTRRLILQTRYGQDYMTSPLYGTRLMEQPQSPLGFETMHLCYHEYMSRPKSSSQPPRHYRRQPPHLTTVITDYPSLSSPPHPSRSLKPFRDPHPIQYSRLKPHSYTPRYKQYTVRPEPSDSPF